MAILKRVFQILSYFCYALIGIYAIICSPMLFGCRPVVVLSGSMRPTYEVGTIIYYKKVDEGQLKAGDIITYKLNSTLVTHRIERIENGKYVTQGDANNVEDSNPVSYENIEGSVGGLAIPVIGFGVQFINEHMWVFAILVVILLAEFLLSNMKSDKISISKKGQEHDDDE